MNNPEKIKVFGKPEVNCEVIVDKRNPVWETRYYNEETDWVYAYHKQYLWPQRQSGQYYRFRLLKELDQDKMDIAERVFQEFMDYQHFNKDSNGETKHD